MGALRDLDDRVVPRVAARLRATVDATRSRRGAALRDAPRVGLVVVAAVLLAGAGLAVALGDDDGARPVPALVLGPAEGTAVPDYLARARERTVALAQDAPDGVHVALVSLEAYRTPEEVGSLLAGLEVERAYLTVPSSDPSEVLSADVQDLVTDLRALYAATAERKAEDSQELLALSRGVAGSTPDDTAFREYYASSSRLAGREAQAYRTGCPCVFAAVARGPASVLAGLAGLDGVRAVEAAPAGAGLGELRVRPLAPEQTTTVTARAVPRPPRTGG